jgi:hypothetical protein
MDISVGAKPFGSRLWPCPVYVWLICFFLNEAP